MTSQARSRGSSPTQSGRGRRATGVRCVLILLVFTDCAVEAPLHLPSGRATPQKGSAVAHSVLEGGSLSRTRQTEAQAHRDGRLHASSTGELQHHHVSRILTSYRSGKSAAMAAPRDARPASRTAPSAAPPTASPARPPSAAMRRPWRARTHICAPTSPTCRHS
jgi:hypothetical protein